MREEPPIVPPGAPEAAHLKDLFDLARNLRGAFIDQAIWIDVLLTGILAHYFVPGQDEKRGLLSSDVLAGPDSSFSGRIELLKKVVTRSFGDFGENHPELFDRLDKIRRFRNRLAHAHLDTRDRFLAQGRDDRIQLVFYEGGEQKTQVITRAEAKARLAECTQVVMSLLELHRRVESSA